MGVDETVLPALSLALSLMNLLEEPTSRSCNWWAPVAASEVATWLPYTEERGEATLGCRRDLSCCRRPSAGSLGVVGRTTTTGEGGRAGDGARSLQRRSGGESGDLLCLNKTPKRRHFDARSIKTTSF